MQSILTASLPATGARSAAMATGTSTIRVFLADDHRVTLWGLQQLIDSARPEMEVVGTALTRAELVAHPALAETDLLVLDLDLAGEDGCTALADVQRRCRGHVLILTADEDVAHHRHAVMQGARGVLHKSESADTVLRAIRKVHEGEVWLHRNIVAELLGQLTGRSSAPPPAPDPNTQRIASLTPREREIVVQLVRMSGRKQLAVADALGLSEHTLRNHLTAIYSKLGVHGRLELHLFATEHGLNI
ncbi:response regulator transcription factor [Ideonella sp. YS5]|uniref:response regulator transcription factor n=1 Tax=Ideonella sp. YS5 TaxID=3453714 RepID=UPI003EED0404